MNNRAYALIEGKSLDENRRVFSGIATTPSTDRVFDSIDPMGAKFSKEIPLLHGHRSDLPIGVVRLGKPTKAGIPFEAEIPVVHEPPALKERVDVAWGELVHRLVRAVSIGFRPTKQPTLNDKGGLDFAEIEIMELSTVAIPANAQALIDTIKQYDAEALKAATGADPNPADDTPAAPGNKGRVVKLDDTTARDRAKPFVIRSIVRTTK